MYKQQAEENFTPQTPVHRYCNLQVLFMLQLLQALEFLICKRIPTMTKTNLNGTKHSINFNVFKVGQTSTTFSLTWSLGVSIVRICSEDSLLSPSTMIL